MSICSGNWHLNLNSSSALFLLSTVCLFKSRLAGHKHRCPPYPWTRCVRNRYHDHRRHSKILYRIISAASLGLVSSAWCTSFFLLFLSLSKITTGYWLVPHVLTPTAFIAQRLAQFITNEKQRSWSWAAALLICWTDRFPEISSLLVPCFTFWGNRRHITSRPNRWVLYFSPVHNHDALGLIDPLLRLV